MKSYPLIRSFLSFTCTGLLSLVALALLASPAAAQEKKPADVAGTWKWTFTTQNGQTFDSTLKLKQDGEKITGVYVGRGGTEIAIEEAKLKADELSFKITRERDGQKFVAKYNGKVSGDAIKGKVETDFGGQTRERDWEAKRENTKPAASASGLWRWSFTRSNGEVSELNVKLDQEGEKLSGNFIWVDGSELPISEGEIKNNELAFKVITETDNRTIKSKFTGKVNGDEIAGKIESDYSGENKTYDWTPKRVK
ncbi:MAG: hypothetical protein AB1813_27525 [Verrucomicrobiota bacterium]|jgi:uncharacterized protein YegP (UPF0339 family)